MKQIEYTMTLLSDAEPGTGMGGELVNERVPRDADGKPVLPANHIKGLLREELLKIERCVAGSSSLDDLTNRCLGRPDDEQLPDEAQNEAICRFTDAEFDEKTTNASVSNTKATGETDFITRTAIDGERGRAKDGSLRTSERIAAGTVFRGRILFADEETSQEALAVRCGLLAIGAVGGNRNRGVGRVLISIKDEKRTPGELLKTLSTAPCHSRQTASRGSVPEAGEKLKTLRLLFTAEGPVCLPERPIGVGPIKSGFAIDAGAVRGGIVNRFAFEHGENFATALFECGEFRAWPLLPCGFSSEKTDCAYPCPTRVSLTHKIAKLVADGESLNPDKVEDKPIQEVEWEKVPNNSPLKASDGVLLDYHGINGHESAVELWKAGTMPRIMTAHGVHNDPNTQDGRNLYQVESMAPMVWSGVVVVPEKWADILLTSYREDDTAAFGRFRSTRGFGQLRVEECAEEGTGLPWSQTAHDNILILQSPILLSDKKNDPSVTANQEFENLIRSKWKDLFDKLGTAWDVRAVSTNVGIRFGWNRSGKGKMTGKGRRLSAQRVVLPGSIFEVYPKAKESDKSIVLTNEEQQMLRGAGLAHMIQCGLGSGVERGFGAVSVHPGMANKIYQKADDRFNQKVSNKKAMAEIILALWGKNKAAMPSASQISAVAGIAAKNRDTAGDYLKTQLARLEKIWAAWRPIQKEIGELLSNKAKYDDSTVQYGLKLLSDLVKYQDSKKNTTEGGAL